MRLNRKIFLLIITAALGVGFLLNAGMASAVEKDAYGLEKTAGGTDLPALSISKGTPQSLAETIVKRVLFFVGTIFFLLVLYAGISWMTAGGSTEKVNTAKTILETAIIGLIVIIASYAISTYVFQRFTGGETEGGGGEITCDALGGECQNSCVSGLGEVAHLEATGCEDDVCCVTED